MRVLLAPDAFRGALTAPQVAAALADGWRSGAPHDDVRVVPLADGGPGTVEALHATLGGELVPLTVPGPLGQPTPAVLLVVPGASGPVVHVEAAQALGLHLVGEADRDATRASSEGLGALLAAALELGPSRVVVAAGGTATHDGGAGMLAGLGLASPRLRAGGGALLDVVAHDLEGLADVRRRFAGVDLVAAYDVDVPLLGLHGASAVTAVTKGATPEQAQGLERALSRWAARVADAGLAGARRDLLAPGAGRGAAQLPGSGAGGGIAFALGALGARLVDGARVVAQEVALQAAVQDSDLVVTGTRTLGGDAVHAGVVPTVAGAAASAAVPVVVLAGEVQLGRREWASAGIAGVYALADRPTQVEELQRDPAGALAARARRVARTWSR